MDGHRQAAGAHRLGQYRSNQGNRVSYPRGQLILNRYYVGGTSRRYTRARTTLSKGQCDRANALDPSLQHVYQPGVLQMPCARLHPQTAKEHQPT
eukprot:434851-Pleurochrysis_carterae.AAC.1